MIAQVAKVTVQNALHKALRLHEERATRLGCSTKPYWYLSAALSLVNIQYDTSQSATLKSHAIDRVSRLYYKMLSLQEEPNAQNSAREVRLFLARNSTEALMRKQVVLVDPPDLSKLGEISTTPMESLSAQTFSDAGLQLDVFDFGSTSEWMLDDFWFLNNAPPTDLGHERHLGA